jgi:hypothetical protein
VGNLNKCNDSRSHRRVAAGGTCDGGLLQAAELRQGSGGAQGKHQPSGGDTNGGLDLNMWASVVDRDGTVCAVAFTGKDRGAQWPGIG